MNNKDSHQNLIQRIELLENENRKQKQLIQSYQTNKKKYTTAFENMSVPSFIAEEDTTISLVNKEFEILSGYSKEEIEGRFSITHFITEREKIKVIEYHCLRRTNTPLVPRMFETEFINKEGVIKPIFIADKIIPNSNRGSVSIFDLSEIKNAEKAFLKQRAYFQQLFENSPQAIMVLDAFGKVVNVNKGFETLFKFRADEIKGKSGKSILVPKNKLVENELFFQSILKGNTIHKDSIRRSRDDRIIPVSIIGYPITINRNIEGIFFILEDISERKDFEDQLKHQSFYDSLTTLPNRFLFLDRLERAIVRKGRFRNFLFAVLVVDLDRFKAINDSLGHYFGDQLIKEISTRLHECIRPIDTLARLGGDEFAILTENFSTQKEVLLIAERIIQTTKIPFTFENQEVHVSASVGIILHTKNYTRSEDVLRDAEIAMYQAKDKGKAQYKIFSKQMHESAVKSLAIETDLRNGIRKKEFTLYYQPIISVDNLKLQGFEALIRWVHPQRGIISPLEFIPIAEETNLIIRIGEWIIEEACQQLSKWHRNIPGCKHLTVNVNLSAIQFIQQGIESYIEETLKKYNLSPANLKIELTETMLMEDTSDVITRLKQLKKIGLKLVIDDFGTGYSSLSYIKQFPIDHLKIDQSFIVGLGKDSESLEIVKAILSLAKSLNLGTVAEGVENNKQLKHLKELGCDTVQGYLFSKPVDQRTASVLIKRFL